MVNFVRRKFDEVDDYVDADDLNLEEIPSGVKVFARQSNASNFIGARVLVVIFSNAYWKLMLAKKNMILSNFLP